MKRILVLGSGFVAEPVVEYLNRNGNNSVAIASVDKNSAKLIADKFDSVDYKIVDVSDSEELKQLVNESNLVISLVPAFFHTKIARICIDSQVNMVTASYESFEMQALRKEIEEAGICVMNEIGLDPGIDHLAAMKIIDKINESGDEIESFVSWCGGIPALNNNPLGYKFSWEPRGAISVLLNEARYQFDNEIIDVPGEELMQWHKNITVSDIQLECYPNRESVHYKQIYGIESVKDIIRGTLRYRGFCDVFQDLKKLGLMQTRDGGVSEAINWKNYILSLSNAEDIWHIRQCISHESYRALDWLGVFSDNPVSHGSSSLDVLCNLLLEKLSYQSTEKDMIVLQHKFVIKRADGSRYFISSTLKQTGVSEGYSAMAKTVGYPVAMAAELILQGKIENKGLLLPVSSEVYQPILSLLEEEGICFQDKYLNDLEISKQDFLKELY